MDRQNLVKIRTTVSTNETIERNYDDRTNDTEMEKWMDLDGPAWMERVGGCGQVMK